MHSKIKFACGKSLVINDDSLAFFRMNSIWKCFFMITYNFLSKSPHFPKNNATLESSMKKSHHIYRDNTSSHGKCMVSQAVTMVNHALQC